MIKHILEAPTATEAIKLANNAIDSGEFDRIYANLCLRRRATERFGSLAGSFTPRVANLWLEGGFGEEYFALLTLAVAQDYEYPCEASWTVRKVVVKEAISKYEDWNLKRHFSKVLKDRYLFNRLARDYNDLSYVLSLAAKNSPINHFALPISNLPEDIHMPVDETTAEDNWLKLKLKKEY